MHETEPKSIEKMVSSNIPTSPNKNLLESLVPQQILVSLFETKENTIFEDTLEEDIFLFLLEQALQLRIGATSAMLAEITHKTKNTVNIRLERLYYKGLIHKQQLGNSIIYYFPITQLLFKILLTDIASYRKTYQSQFKNYTIENSIRSAIQRLITQAAEKYLTATEPTIRELLEEKED